MRISNHAVVVSVVEEEEKGGRKRRCLDARGYTGERLGSLGRLCGCGAVAIAVVVAVAGGCSAGLQKGLMYMSRWSISEDFLTFGINGPV